MILYIYIYIYIFKKYICELCHSHTHSNIFLIKLEKQIFVSKEIYEIGKFLKVKVIIASSQSAIHGTV